MIRAATLSAKDFATLGYDVEASLAAGRAMRVSASGVKRPRRPKASHGAFDSKWEAERAHLLELKRAAGLIQSFRHHPFKLGLPDGGWYTPDFLVLQNDGTEELEEIKGHWRHDSGSRKRFTIAAGLNRKYVFRVWTKRRGEWVNIETRNSR